MSTTDQNDRPLGYCTECVRVRWLAHVAYWLPVEGGKQEGSMPVGRCTQCERVLPRPEEEAGGGGTGPGPELLGPARSENFDPDDPIACEHGYTEGCPDCDVPSHFPAVLGEGLSEAIVQKGNIRMLREIRTIGGDDDD